jgi:tetratricopeptide (TPR) repeat protein
LDLSEEQTAEEFFKEGQKEYKLGKYNKAIEDFTKAIELNLDDAKLYYYRGGAHEKLGEYTEALKNYKKGIGINLLNLQTIRQKLQNINQKQETILKSKLSEQSILFY